jgi:hypothetical protein
MLMELKIPFWENGSTFDVAVFLLGLKWDLAFKTVQTAEPYSPQQAP